MTELLLQTILRNGGSIVIDATSFNPLQLSSIASYGKQFGAHLVIKKATHLNPLQCGSIASANPGNVTFDFTE